MISNLYKIYERCNHKMLNEAILNTSIFLLYLNL